MVQYTEQEIDDGYLTPTDQPTDKSIPDAPKKKSRRISIARRPTDKSIPDAPKKKSRSITTIGDEQRTLQ
jgi:hypothetical protein